MTQILARDPDNRTRDMRLGKMGRGPGVFVYDGGRYVVEHSPTVLLTKKKQIRTDEDGAPVQDSSGRLVYDPAGQPVLDHDGITPRMGGKPKAQRIELAELVVWGVKFPKGKHVKVSDAALALKLRCLGVREVGAAGEAAEVDEPVSGRERKKRDKKAKEHSEAAEVDEQQ